MEIDKNKQFNEIVLLIQQAQGKAIKAVNKELIELYWNIGKYISGKIKSSVWGESVVKELAEFLNRTDPTLKGFSDKNLWRMKKFYEAYRESPKLSPLAREISWSNNLIILTRARTVEEQEFYLRTCIAENYSKRELERQISSSLFERTILGNSTLSPVARVLHPAITNSFKDNYVLEFLGLPDHHKKANCRKDLFVK